MSRQQFILAHHAARQRALDAVRLAPEGYVVEVRQKTRTLEQNALMWSMLSEISEGIEWYGQRLTKEEWKDVFTAALNRQKVVPGLDGGFVVIGTRTRNMTKKEMTDLIELMRAFTAERSFVFSWEAPPPMMMENGETYSLDYTVDPNTGEIVGETYIGKK